MNSHARLALVLLLGAAAPACNKLTPTKAAVGPLSAERYEVTAADGSKLDCYVFGGESNKPARLCGAGQTVPGGDGVLFLGEAPAADSKFITQVGEPLPAGYYLIKPLGTTSLDVWPLGPLPMKEWLAGGKVLLSVENSGDHHTRVKLIDPVGRGVRELDAGQLKADSFLLVRAPGDVAFLLVQRLGGQEMVLVKDPAGNAELSVADASDEKTEGNKRLFKRGEPDRANGGIFKPNAGVIAAFSWKGSEPQFDGQPLGPFVVPPQH